MKVAQRIIGMAAIATVAACASNGGLGNVLGGLVAFAVAWYLTAIPVLFGSQLLR